MRSRADWSTRNVLERCGGAKHQGGYRIRRGALGIEWLTPHGAHYTVLDHPRHSSPLELRLDQHLHRRRRTTNLRH